MSHQRKQRMNGVLLLLVILFVVFMLRQRASHLPRDRFGHGLPDDCPVQLTRMAQKVGRVGLKQQEQEAAAEPIRPHLLVLALADCDHSNDKVCAGRTAVRARQDAARSAWTRALQRTPDGATLLFVQSDPDAGDEAGSGPGGADPAATGDVITVKPVAMDPTQGAPAAGRRTPVGHGPALAGPVWLAAMREVRRCVGGPVPDQLFVLFTHANVVVQPDAILTGVVDPTFADRASRPQLFSAFSYGHLRVADETDFRYEPSFPGIAYPALPARSAVMMNGPVARWLLDSAYSGALHPYHDERVAFAAWSAALGPELHDSRRWLGPGCKCVRRGASRSATAASLYTTSLLTDWRFAAVVQGGDTCQCAGAASVTGFTDLADEGAATSVVNVASDVPGHDASVPDADRANAHGPVLLRPAAPAGGGGGGHEQRYLSAIHRRDGTLRPGVATLADGMLGGDESPTEFDRRTVAVSLFSVPGLVTINGHLTAPRKPATSNGDDGMPDQTGVRLSLLYVALEDTDGKGGAENGDGDGGDDGARNLSDGGPTAELVFNADDLDSPLQVSPYAPLTGHDGVFALSVDAAASAAQSRLAGRNRTDATGKINLCGVARWTATSGVLIVDWPPIRITISPMQLFEGEGEGDYVDLRVDCHPAALKTIRALGNFATAGEKGLPDVFELVHKMSGDKARAHFKRESLLCSPIPYVPILTVATLPLHFVPSFCSGNPLTDQFTNAGACVFGLKNGEY